jgi:putative endonuclease
MKMKAFDVSWILAEAEAKCCNGGGEWLVYVCRGRLGALYAGIAKDVERRVREHNTSKRGAKWARGQRPVELLWSSSLMMKIDAMLVERMIKKLSRKEKCEFIGCPVPSSGKTAHPYCAKAVQLCRRACLQNDLGDGVMSKTLREELVELVGRWRMPPAQPKPETITFESIRDGVEQELRLRAEGGCSTWSAHLSTHWIGGRIGCLGTTGDPDKDEAIMRQVASWLSDQGLIVGVRRHDEPAKEHSWYGDEEPGFSSTSIEVRWK